MSVRALIRGTLERALVSLPRRTRNGDRLVLAYHNVVPDSAQPAGDRSLHLSHARFREQLRAVTNEADVVPLMDVLTRTARGERRVAITFDDAYASALTLGVGECVARGMASTVFVAPALLDTVPHWDWASARGAWSHADREQFLWQEGGRVRGMDAAGADALPETLRIATADTLRVAALSDGVTLGNHTMTHPNLGALTTPEVLEELNQAHAWLRAFVPERHVPVVAYPFGHAPRDPAAAVPTTVALHGLMVTGKWASHDQPPLPLAYPRWNVPAGLSTQGFRARLRGWMAGR